MDNHWLAATFTSANGEFNFNHIMPGCYQLKISRVGYYDEVHNNFEVTAGNTALLDLHMEGITDQANSGYSPAQGQSLTSLSRNRTMMKTGKRDSRALSSYVSGVTKSSQKWCKCNNAIHLHKIAQFYSSKQWLFKSSFIQG
jgi:hypothetical protein